MWAIDSDLVEEWLVSLDEDSYTQVIAALRIVESDGPALGRPLVDTIKASRHRNMKELRPGSSGRSEVRISSRSTRGGERSCWWPATSEASGRSGTARTSPSRMRDTTII